jgi:hypothetical protein
MLKVVLENMMIHRMRGSHVPALVRFLIRHGIESPTLLPSPTRMMSFGMFPISRCTLLLRLAQLAAADSNGGDFTNNLFSDIAP